MEKVTLKAKKFIGISVRTSNDQEAVADIPNLWQRFMSEGILAQIPNKINDTIYSIYTEYEGDHTQPYTTILGCEVTSLDEIPAGFKSCEVPESEYAKFTETGNMTEGFIINVWMKIWKLDLNRTYQADFEVYGEKAQNPANAEVDIYIGING
ncbi:Predicted transcriptional regulator YdeE, contains AraC-type DNA-binding domain [Spirosomataceae bacterium TFI 002]|nr:Predicted transcriptional regulator YdeE, contains AraC-type DNA-binding domain [Spirosomataceae bacterium TFI 002]